ncbi:GspE/PulE family protein [Microbacterium sp. zg.Y1090]|uniref:GspE/PulE family protein n=1 Tax=Microbacterium wangruii TaxID=3049073 RepID=UPI00214D56C1|nr:MULTISPECIES: GspE/PulE family protein [unclassified Microbacterium]MCR2819900.1 GspE/PulE family protein [Microbacterium sp. zg.Y1090]WIM27488.1 GspE/PulE family protein [Microbacterium sp. zg-Y1090]
MADTAPVALRTRRRQRALSSQQEENRAGDAPILVASAERPAVGHPPAPRPIGHDAGAGMVASSGAPAFGAASARGPQPPQAAPAAVAPAAPASVAPAASASVAPAAPAPSLPQARASQLTPPSDPAPAVGGHGSDLAMLAEFSATTRPGQPVHVASAGAALPVTPAAPPAGPSIPRPAPEPELEPEQTPQQLAVALAARHGLAYVDLTEFAVDPTVVHLIPDQMCRKHLVLPISRVGERLMVVVSDPGNVVVLDDVAAVVRAPIVAAVAEPEAILAAIDRYHRADAEMDELTSSFESTAEEDAWSQDVGDSAADEGPIIRFVNVIISQAIMDRASDIHIEPGREELRVRYRIDGVLTTVHTVPRSMIPGVISRLKVMAELDIGERRKPQDGRISVGHAGRTVDLRVATLPTVWGEKVVARILDSPVASLKLDDLGMLERNMDVFRASFSKPYGMILVTGPTGSGKSTTLYTTLATISKPTVNVITVEDPVEYRMSGINQVQVNPKAGLTFAAALRSILRSDPDVILIGEIRDEETAKIAIESSLTGHLVLSTLHTNDAPSSVTRLIEMGVEPFLVGSALDSVVAQRLARRLCAKCKVKSVATGTELAILGVAVDPAAGPPKVYRSTGCSQCSNTGYRGRIALHEVMAVDDEIERLAVANAPTAQIAAHAEANGMMRLRMDGWAKVLRGHTTIDEILRVTV